VVARKKRCLKPYYPTSHLFIVGNREETNQQQRSGEYDARDDEKEITKSRPQTSLAWL